MRDGGGGRVTHEGWGEGGRVTHEGWGEGGRVTHEGWGEGGRVTHKGEGRGEDTMFYLGGGSMVWVCQCSPQDFLIGYGVTRIPSLLCREHIIPTPASMGNQYPT